MSKVQKMVDAALEIARDDSHGYSQRRRWPSQGTDFDCSSLMYYCAHEAGYDVPLSGYTGTMLADFTRAGFDAVPFDGNLGDLEPGDILLNVVNHTEMYVGDGKFAGAHSSETGGTDGKPGDQTGDEISVCDAYVPSFGWDYVLVPPKESTSPSGKALNGIDIASHQAGIDVSKVEADFVIVKVSGGTSYVNDRAHGAWKDWRDIANDVLKSDKLLGLYHYACEYDSEPGGKAEAEFFLRQIKGFEGKAVLCLDWEAHAQSIPVSYAKAWLDAVAKATGSTPLFYGYASYLNSRDHSSISKYPLWMASYLERYEWGSGYVSNPDNIWDTGSWAKMAMYQYASTRTVKGYDDRLDVNVFYGTRDDWAKLAGGSTPTPAPTPTPQPTKKPVKYRSSNDKAGKKWLSEYKDIQRDGYSGSMGKPIRWLAIGDVQRYRVCTEESGWLPWVTGYDIHDLEDGCAGDGSPINGVQIDDDSVRYAVHISRGWYSDMVGLHDTGGTGDNFAGDLANRIDAFRASRERQ